MNKNRQLSSTERLLDIIRDGSRTSPADGSLPGTSPGRINQPSFFRQLSGFSVFRAPFSVGIDIRQDVIHLVKVRRGGKSDRRIIGQISLPLPPGLSLKDPEMAGIVKQALVEFCGRRENVSLWAAVPQENPDVRRFLIPRVPPQKMPDVVFFNIKKSLEFNDKEYLWDFEIQEEISVGEAPKVAVLAFTALKRDIDDIQNFFLAINWPLDGLTLIPLAMQNLFRLNFLEETENARATLSIGNSSSRIEIFHKGNLFLTRNIKAGANSLKESILDIYEERHQKPKANNLSPAPREERQKIHFLDEASNLSNDFYSLGRSLFGPIDPRECFKLILPALDRLVRQVTVTFDHFHAAFGDTRIDQIYLASVIGPDEPILAYIQERLETRVLPLDPFALPSQAIIGESSSKEPKPIMAPALGLALANRIDTPNFLFTFREKLKQKEHRRIDTYVAALFLAILILTGGIYAYLERDIGKSRREMAAMQAEHQKMTVQVDREALMRQLGDLKQQATNLAAYGERIYSLAPLAELTHLTPQDIGLSHLKLTFSPPTPDGKKTTTKSATRGQATMTGMVNPKVTLPEKALADFVIRLEGSPLFSDVVISQSSPNAGQGNINLNFTLEGKLD